MEIIKTQNGFLTILTGKTDMGKSTITVYECSEMLKRGEQVMFFSYEYCQSIIYNKMISHFGLKWQELFNLNIVDASGLSLGNIIEMIKLKGKHLDAVYVDYLDLLKIATYPETENTDMLEMERIQEIVRELAKLADELKIKIVLLSQTGSEKTIEETVEQLNKFAEKTNGNVVRMFIAKGNVIDTKISFDDISHIILVDGYDLKHFSTINFKEIYKD
mgnify:CR=1 FL=1